MRRPSWHDFVDACESEGLQAKQIGKWKWIIEGGPLTVIYYPMAKQNPMALVVGTTDVFKADVRKAVAATRKPPTCRGDKVARLNDYRGARAKLHKTQGGCFWCSTPLTMNTSTLDHRVPLARGGANRFSNYVLACTRCNRSRGQHMPELREENVQ